VRVEIAQESNAGEIQVFVRDPLPNVPEWMRIQENPGGSPFLTLPAGHHFETSTGQHGFPGDILHITNRFVAGEIGKSEAESRLTTVLEGWSNATNRQRG